MRWLRTVVLGVLAGAGGAAMADPGYYLVTVYENEGEANLDYRYWTVKNRSSAEVVWPEIGFGYGVNKRWYTELLASYIGSGSQATRASSLNWQNDFLLTQGQYDIDVALHTNLIHNYDTGFGGGRVLEYGPVMQTDIGRVQLNANLVFERRLDGGAGKPTQLKYQWQVKYRWKPGLHIGLQGFGELGEWDNWAVRSRQSHRAGPMVSGTLPLGDTQSFRYQAALLSGSIYGQPGTMFSMRLQYVF